MKSYGDLHHGKTLAALNFATKTPGHEGFFVTNLNGVSTDWLLPVTRNIES